LTSDEPSLSLTLFAPDREENNPSFAYESGLYKAGYRNVAGIDEAGRGPLCGPVVSACVILEPDKIPLEINDSKKLSPEKREMLFEEIFAKAKRIGIGIVDERMIDRINILHGAALAMMKALINVRPPPDYILIDGNRKLPTDIPQITLVKGDARSLSIAAASIIAKVVRDRIMIKFDKLYPEYHLNKNMGYPTQAHLKALKKHGPVKIHRRSFKPVKEFFKGC